MTLALFAVGFTAVTAQVLLMRELVATLYGNELGLGLILAAWLAWGAAGSALASRRRSGRLAWRTRSSMVAAGLSLAAVLLPAQLALIRGLRSVLGIAPGAFVGILPTLLAVIFIPAPLCGLLGGLFALAARLLSEPASGARAYLWESAGSVVGGVIFSFGFVRWLDPFQTALLVGALDLAAATTVVTRARLAARNLRLLAAGLVLLILSGPALLLGPVLHRGTLAWQWADLALAVDSPYGRLTVVAREGQRAFFENGLLAFETQSTFPEEVVHFPLLFHPAPRSILLVGGGVGGDLGEILRHPVEEVIYVELDPAVIRAALDHLPPGEASVLADPRVHLIFTDGRRYVQTAGRSFDAVILDLPEPSTGALNRFYTEEFFAEARAILAPGGVLSLGLPSEENYWSPELAQRNASVYWALRESFAQIVVLPGAHNFFLASDRPLPADPAILTGRLAERGIETLWVTPAYIEYVFATDRFSQVRAGLQEMAGVWRNRDRRPVCFYYDLVLWLSRFYPGLGGQPRQLPLHLAVAGVLLGVVVVGRWRRQLAVPLAVGVVGLAEMALEVVILFAFQVSHGTLYGRVSLMVTAFMAGLVVGALAGRWAVLRLRPGGGSRQISLALAGLLGGVALLSALVAFVPLSAPEAVFLVLALVAGGLGGAAFPTAVALVGGEEGRAAGFLYAADLAGGCLGALVTAALLVPLLGLSQAGLIVALAALAGLAVVL
jgi:spermidine synthase